MIVAPQWAQAADVYLSPQPVAQQPYDFALPAVSGPNAKIELYGGVTNPGGAALRAAGSVTIPVGSSFGLQLDAAVQTSGAGLMYGGVAHAFTRDPANYLFGLAGGVVRGPTGTLGVVGVEGEVYLDQVSIEAWAGVAGIDYDVLPDVAGVFVLADVGYYVTDDFRLTAGVSHVIGNNGLHLGAEYLMRDWNVPVSLTADSRITQTGWSVMAGIKGYIGGEPGKSLRDRHRQDDPPNRVLSLFGAAGNLLSAVGPTPPVCTPTVDEYNMIDGGDCYPSDPEQFCIDNGYSYEYNGECYGFQNPD
jgi:hypothetical protein